jgi:hypothetical protein
MPSVVKYGSVIETSEAPDLSTTHLDETFTIHSIVRFRRYCMEEPSMRYVRDSLERHEGFIVFRPILQMRLLNFRCVGKNSGELTCKLEFEEV